ncbi:hypothetical protein KC330_g6377 [Hortaea werneckii]|nr:hypothetical protein KC330_g6377 [Hortaea werneckii]
MTFRTSYCHTHEECHGGFHPADDGDRLFDKDDDAGDFPEISYKGEWWTLVTCSAEKDQDYIYGKPQAHLDTVIIAVDGACRGNGTRDAEASYGVFFHRDNHSWNESFALPDNFKTNQQAELRAALEGLLSAKNLRLLNTNLCGKARRPGPMRELSHVVIKTDSAYLFNAMTKWVFKWRNNDYINCRGRPVTNASLFKQLEAEIQALHKLNVGVQFWHVRREENREADALANAALDGRSARAALGLMGAHYSDDSDSD